MFYDNILKRNLISKYITIVKIAQNLYADQYRSGRPANATNEEASLMYCKDFMSTNTSLYAQKHKLMTPLLCLLKKS